MGRAAFGGEGGRGGPVDGNAWWRDEGACFAKAEEIQRSRPHWIVLWGVDSRVFWAFPMFNMTTLVFAYSRDPADLIARMDRIEEKFRIWPQRMLMTGNDSTTEGGDQR